MSNLLPTDLCPPSPEHTDRILGWCREGVEEAEQFLRNQPNFDKIDRTREIILGADKPLRDIINLSPVQLNETRRIFNTLSADLTDIRPLWSFNTFNSKYERQVRVMSNLATHWYYNGGADREFELAAKAAVVAGSSVLMQTWDRNLQDIRMSYVDIRDALPIRPADITTFQSCLAVTIRKERPVNYVREMFPKWADLIRPDRDASVSAMAARTGLAKVGAMLKRSPWDLANSVFGGSSVSHLGALPVVDVMYTYIDDPARNTTGGDVEMGDWGWAADDQGNNTGKRIPLNSWSYRVEPGQPLYPRKRLVIWTKNVRLYDGPSMYWHGMYPVTKLTLDPMPDSWLGSSALWPILPLQDELDRIMQAISDHMKKVLRPPVSGDRSVSEAELRRIDSRKEGQRWRNGVGGEIKINEIPPLDPIFIEQRNFIIDRMNDLAGVKNFASLAQMGQIPEGETIDKLLFTLNPEVRARSRNLEVAQREQGKMFVYNVAEFYTLARRFTILGEDGITVEDMDLDENTFVPAYTDGDFNNDGRVDPEKVLDFRPRYDRAKEFLRQFSLYIKPGSLLASADSGEKMIYMQLRRSGDLDQHTFLRKMGIPNIGPEPQGNVIERIQQEKLAMMAPQLMMAPGGPQTTPPNVNSAGRKAEGAKPPHAQSGGVSES